jgi:hypothetical protein
MLKKFGVYLAGGAALLLGGVSANADTINLVHVSTTFVDPGDTSLGSVFEYDVVFTGSKITTAQPSTVVLFDFAGYQLGSLTFTPEGSFALAGGDFSASEELTTLGVPVNGSDNGGIYNLVLTMISPSEFTVTQSTIIGKLTAVSNINGTSISPAFNVTSRDFDSSGGTQISFSTTKGPDAAGLPTVAPLPQAAWAGLSLIGLIAAKRRRSNQ